MNKFVANLKIASSRHSALKSPLTSKTPFSFSSLPHWPRLYKYVAKKETAAFFTNKVDVFHVFNRIGHMNSKI